MLNSFSLTAWRVLALQLLFYVLLHLYDVLYHGVTAAKVGDGILYTRLRPLSNLLMAIIIVINNNEGVVRTKHHQATSWRTPYDVIRRVDRK